MLPVGTIRVDPSSSGAVYGVWDDVVYNSSLVIIPMCPCCPPNIVVGGLLEDKD